MGFRFQKRFSILPGLRINMSKGGLSASVGPRGADVNIGKNGVTTSAGIPGTGLSWRSKLGHKGAGLGVLLLIAGLGYWGYSHFAKAEKPAAVPKPVAVTAQAAPVTPPVTSPAQALVRRATGPGPVYVHRAGSVLRDVPKSSGKTLKKESKGAKLSLIGLQEDGWAKVTDGALTGYMRASVLGADPPT